MLSYSFAPFCIGMALIDLFLSTLAHAIRRFMRDNNCSRGLHSSDPTTNHCNMSRLMIYGVRRPSELKNDVFGSEMSLPYSEYA